MLMHYAARRRRSEPISTAFVESAVNEIVAFWRPAERNAFLDHKCERTVVEPVKTRILSEKRRPLAPQIGGVFGTPQFSAALQQSFAQRGGSWVSR
jgi:hypothetical protein